MGLSERVAARLKTAAAGAAGSSVPPGPGAFGQGFPELLAAAKVGAPWALEALYRELHPRVLAFMASRAPGEAEDLAADVFVAMAEGLHRFEGDETRLRAWVFTIAYRRLIDTWRRARRRRTEPAEPADLVDRVPVGDAEAEAVASLSTAEALRAIAQLPSPQAEVVLLRVIGDLPVEDVAAVVGRRPGAVRVIQHRALIRLARTAAGETDGVV